jgi:BASS family bile acid:Na+ symporter
MLIADPMLRALAIIFLTTAMFDLGLETTRVEIREALTTRRFLRNALLANLVLAPALGLLVAYFAPLAREVKLGIALLALAPGAPFGIQFMRMVKGSEAVAVGLAFLLTAIALVYSPAAAALLLPLEDPIRLPYGRIAAAMLLYLLLPLLAGLALHQRAPGVARKLRKPLFPLATVVFLSLMFMSGDVRQEGLRVVGGAGMLAMLAIIVGAMMIGWWLGGPEAGNRRVLAVSTSMRNVLVAELIATTAFPVGNVGAVALAFFALMVPSNFLFHLGLVGYDKWQARHLPGPTGQPA